MRQTTTIPKYALPFLQPGRLVRFLVSDQYAVHEADTDSSDGSSSLGVTCDPAMAWGIVLNFKRAGSEETAGNEVRCRLPLHATACAVSIEANLRDGGGE